MTLLHVGGAKAAIVWTVLSSTGPGAMPNPVLVSVSCRSPAFGILVGGVRSWAAAAPGFPLGPPLPDRDRRLFGVTASGLRSLRCTLMLDSAWKPRT